MILRPKSLLASSFDFLLLHQIFGAGAPSSLSTGSTGSTGSTRGTQIWQEGTPPQQRLQNEFGLDWQCLVIPLAVVLPRTRFLHSRMCRPRCCPLSSHILKIPSFFCSQSDISTSTEVRQWRDTTTPSGSQYFAAEYKQQSIHNEQSTISYQ